MASDPALRASGVQARAERSSPSQPPVAITAESRATNHAEPHQLERARRQVARIQDDPNAAFSGEMKRFASASQPPPMIGLVRVAHELGVALELQIEGDRLTVSTLCPG